MAETGSNSPPSEGNGQNTSQDVENATQETQQDNVIRQRQEVNSDAISRPLRSFEEGIPSSSGASSRKKKLRLDFVFLSDWEGDTSSLIREEKFDAAYGILNRRNLLGSRIRGLKFLLKYCVTLFVTGRVRRCADVRRTLAERLMESIYISLDSALAFAVLLKGKKKFFESILFSVMTAEMFSKVSDGRTRIVAIDKSMSALRETVLELVEQNKRLRPFVQKYVIPLMVEMKNAALSMENVDTRTKIIKVAWIMHYIEVCDSDISANEKILSDAVDMMRDTFGEDAFKCQIFGTCLNNLGSTYMRLSQIEKALGTYSEALDCFEKADDFETETKKQDYIQRTQQAMQRAQLHMSVEVSLIELVRQATA